MDGAADVTDAEREYWDEYCNPDGHNWKGYWQRSWHIDTNGFVVVVTIDEYGDRTEQVFGEGPMRAVD